MSSFASPHLSELEALGLDVIFSPTAQDAWDDLLKRAEVSELSYEISRLIPMLHKKLLMNSDVVGYDKLSGFVKKNWVVNTIRFSAVNRVLIDLYSQNIKVVILKGLALSLHQKSFGIRYMNDIDLLIASKNLIETLEILANNGFKAKYGESCPHKVMTIKQDSDAFVDSEGNEIDLHVLNDSDSFFTELYKTSVLTTYNDSDYQIPNLEFLVLHAIKHGLKGVGKLDLVQSILDIHLIGELDNLGAYREISKNFSMTSEVDIFIDVLSKKGILKIPKPSGIQVKKLIKFPFRTLFIPVKIFENLQRVRAKRSLLNINLKSALYSVAQVPIRFKIIYFFWIYFGRLRPMESFFITRGVTFTKNIYFTDSTKLINFSTLISDNVTTSSRSKEFRFRIIIEKPIKEVKFLSISEQFIPHHIFLNGKLGDIQSSRNTQRINVDRFLLDRNGQKFLEVSIRNCFNECGSCFQTLSKSSIELVD